MSFLPEPDPLVLGFLVFRKFIYLELLAALALIRVIVGRGIARWPALVTLIMAGGGVATTLAPAAGLNDGPVYAFAARMMAEGGGMAALLVPSAVFLICSITPRARWRIIDAVHGVMLLSLLVWWWWVS